MGDSDDGLNEHSIFDLDHAPPPPPSHRGVGRTLSPQQAVRRSSYTLSPLKQSKEKIAGRSRIWSTDSAAPSIKSIWSDNVMEPMRNNNINSNGNAPDAKPPQLPAFLDRRSSSGGEMEQQRERRASESSKPGSFRNLSASQQSLDNRRPSMIEKLVLRSLSPLPNNNKDVDDDAIMSDDDDSLIQNLRNSNLQLPFDRSSGSIAMNQDGQDSDQIQRSGDAIGEESIGSFCLDNDQPNKTRRLSQSRKVSFENNSMQEREASSRTLIWSPDLSGSQVLEEGEPSSSSSAASSSEEIDYGYGDPLNSTDSGLGLSSSKSSEFQTAMARQRTESQNSVGTWSQAQSDLSDQKDNDDTEFDPDDESSTHQVMNGRPPVVIARMKLPKCISSLPTVNDIAVKVVIYCFCGCCCRLGMRQLTDRTILGRLNVLIALFSVFPLCATAFLAVALYSPLIGLDRHIPPQLDTHLSNGPIFSLSETLWNMNSSFWLCVRVYMACRSGC
jgi:hypothetical protein